MAYDPAFEPIQKGNYDPAFEPLQTPKQPFSFEKMATNIPSSAMNFGKAVVQPIIHPLDTLQNIGEVAGGGMEKVFPSGAKDAPKDIAKFDSVVNFFKQRYGGVENLKQTVQNDPVGFAADLSAVLSAGGGTLAKAGELSKIGAVEKAGQIASRAGSAIEPISAVTPVIKFAGNRAADVLGVTTGAGTEAVKQAFTNSNPELRAAMRGNTEGLDFVNDAKNAFEGIKEQRRQAYQAQLPKAVANPTQFTQQIQDLKNSLEQRLIDFKIKTNPDGTLDFSRSKVSKDGLPIVEEAAQKIKAWGTQPDDFSVEGLDTLKQQLDDLIPKTGQARAFVTPLKKQVRDTLVSNVPEYGKLVKDYEEASNTIKDIEKAFSLGGNVGADTILRKLNQSLRQGFEFRQSKLSELDQKAGSNLVSQIAGSQLSPYAPRGLARTSAEVLGGTGAVLVQRHLMNPEFMAFLAAASPRLVGETLSLIGIPTQKIGQIMNAIYSPKVGQVIFQTGRASQK